MVPPKPRLFKAIAILGVLIGGFGAVQSLGEVTNPSRSRSVQLRLRTEFRNDQHARVVRQMEAAVGRVIDRHRRVSSAVTIASGMLSTLLFVTSIGLAGRRTWARALMVQAAIACSLYEVPAAVHQVRLEFEALQAQERFLPAVNEALDQPGSPEAITLTTHAVMMIILSYTVGMALLRLLYFGITIHYLRRKDVRSWFQEPETL